MAVEVFVTSNLPQVRAYMRQAERQAVPMAHAKALTFTAEAVHEAEKAEMQRVFDRPTRYTMNALAKTTATPKSLKASVFMKHGSGSTTPASNYLMPHVRGGSRRQKRSEKALQRVMGNKGFWVPGAGAKRDAHGNISGSTIKRVLSQTKTGDPYQWQTAKSKKRNARRVKDAFFVPQPTSKLKPGVYRRIGRKIEPFLIFVSSVSYKKRFDFYGLANRVASREFPRKFDAQLRRELARLYPPR